jgi:hypothetical protein
VKLGGPSLYLGLLSCFFLTRRLQGIKQVTLVCPFSLQRGLKVSLARCQGLQPLVHLLGAAARMEFQHLFHFLHGGLQALGRLSWASVALATQQQTSHGPPVNEVMAA